MELFTNINKKRHYLLLVLIIIILLNFCFLLTACKEEHYEGEITCKEFLKEYTTIKIIPVIVHNGKTTSTIMIPYTHHYPDRWKLTIQWYADNKFHNKNIYVTKECYDSVNIGDWFVYNKSFCSLKEPCTKTRENG